MRLWPVLLVTLGWAAPGLAAEEVFATAGQSSSLQKREISARVAALGGNGVSLEGGADSVLSNPAAMAKINSLELGAHHQSWLAAINQEDLTAAGPAPGGGAWGLALGLVDYGQMEAVDEFGQPLGGIGAQDYSLTLAWARAAGAGFSIGGSARLIQEVLAGQSLSQASMDVGLLWKQKKIQVGFLFANVSSTLLSGSRGPTALRVEVSGDLLARPGDLRYCGGFSAEPDGLSRVELGFEAALYQQALIGRMGYEMRLGETLLQGFGGATFGMGFNLGSTVLDYAYLPFGDLGAGHRVSVKWHGSPSAPAPPPTRRKASAGAHAYARSTSLAHGDAHPHRCPHRHPASGSGEPAIQDDRRRVRAGPLGRRSRSF